MPFFNNLNSFCIRFSFHTVLVFFSGLMVNGILFSQNCGSDKWLPKLEKIRYYLKSNRVNAGTDYFDSLKAFSPEILTDDCEFGLWFRYEHGELLELSRRFDLALEEYYNIIYLAERKAWWDLLSYCHLSAARCHESISRKADCLRHLNLANTIIVKHKLKKIEATYAYRYASYHRIYGSKDTASVFAKRAVKLGEQFQISRAITDGNLILGIISKDIDTSCFHFRMAVKEYAKQGNMYGAAVQSSNIASRLFLDGRTDEAKLTLDTAYDFAIHIEKNSKPYHIAKSRIYDKKSEIFKAENQLDSAYHYLFLSNQLSKLSEWTINQDSITQRVLDFAIEKEKEKNVYLEKSTMLLRWGFITTIATLILFLVLFAINRKRRLKIEKQNNIIQEQNSALEHLFQKQSTLLSEVHHRVKNNLQLVISLLTLHGKNYQDKPLNDLMDEVSAKVKSIALIHEQLYSTGEFEKIHVQEYLEKLMHNFETLQAEKNSFGYEVKVDDLFFNLETVMPIGIIASELISNALKYARLKNQELFLSMAVHKTENGYIFSYHDNGPGIKAEIENSDKNTIGMSLIKSMVRQLQADSKSFNQKGYHFTMVFQEKKVSKI